MGSRGQHQANSARGIVRAALLKNPDVTPDEIVGVTGLRPESVRRYVQEIRVMLNARPLSLPRGTLTLAGIVIRKRAYRPRKKVRGFSCEDCRLYQECRRSDARGDFVACERPIQKEAI